MTAAHNQTRTEKYRVSSTWQGPNWACTNVKARLL